MNSTCCSHTEFDKNFKRKVFMCPNCNSEENYKGEHFIGFANQQFAGHGLKIYSCCKKGKER